MGNKKIYIDSSYNVRPCVLVQESFNLNEYLILEKHDYCNPPKFHCDISNLIMNTFEKKFVFKTFDYNNKIDLDSCSKMHEILKNYYIRKNGIETYNNSFDNDGFDKWVEMLRNDENYNIILCFDDDKLISYLECRGYEVYDYLNSPDTSLDGTIRYFENNQSYKLKEFLCDLCQISHLSSKDQVIKELMEKF